MAVVARRIAPSRRPTPQEAPASVEIPLPDRYGRLDEAARGIVRGWAASRAVPGDRLRVLVAVDGIPAAEVVADEFRPDLLRAEVGDGLHGFTAHLPSVLCDGLCHEVAVSVGNTLLGDAIHAAEEPGAALHLVRAANHYILFDSDYYQSQAGAVDAPLQHYVDQGWRSGLNPHPLFDTRFYLSNHDAGGQDPLTHFLLVGRHRGYATHPLFDGALYYQSRPDVQKAGLHPLLHYLESGWCEGYTPLSPFFDEQHYLSQVQGVREAGFPPLVHYLRFGWREGRRPHPEFDPALYSAMAGLAAHEEPLTRFVESLPGSRKGWRGGVPTVSFIVLNFNKPVLTLQCLHLLRLNSVVAQAEVIVLDNGSHPDAFALLCRHAGDARILRLNVNRGFGEGNNLAAEAAHGAVLAFVNNDAFVRPGWDDPLLEVMASRPEAGAAGPRFIFPDGRLQEAGAMVAPCGSVTQRGRGLPGTFQLFDGDGPQPVDYCSAAALFVRADAFRRVLGYDLCWDPAYYEDVDLCLKLRLLGLKTFYVPGSEVVHIENGTSSDARLGLQLGGIVEANRTKFVSRWSSTLAGRDGHVAALVAPRADLMQPERRGLPRLGLYTPFPISPGGGERYLLSIAEALSDQFDPVLLMPERYSHVRIATMARELGLDLRHLAVARIDTAATEGPFELFIALGNELLPSVPALGLRNYFCCQFPFPMQNQHFVSHWDREGEYDGYIVYSEFVAAHVRKGFDTLRLPSRPVHVLAPPVPQVGLPAQGREGEGPAIILNVGRLTPGGHCKRQDVMVDAFKQLLPRAGRPVELHLAGALGPGADSREYLRTLQRAAGTLPVKFHVNASPEQIHALYQSATVYWHLTGIGADPEVNPELFEHFGITVGEAMSAGAVPVVLRQGGPAGIIIEGQSGLLVSSTDELVDRTAMLLSPAGAVHTARLSAGAARRAADFAPGVFVAALQALVTAGVRAEDVNTATLPSPHLKQLAVARPIENTSD